MSAPIIQSIVFDKTAYASGDTIAATMTFVPGSSGQTQTLTGTAVDSSTGLAGMLSVSFVVSATDGTVVSASDTGARKWTVTSQSAGQAVLTAVA